VTPYILRKHVLDDQMAFQNGVLKV
jgi:hypothetical protein